MGLNVGLNALTSGGLSLSVILLVVTGILLVSASNRVLELSDFDSSSELQKIYQNLRTAYALMFIAAIITLILAIAYGGHEVAWCPSEWIHSIIYVLLLAAMIIGIIYAYVALNDLYKPDIHDRNGSTSFIWAALVIGVITFMLIIATASGRVGYNVVKNNTNDRVRHAERKVHEMHSHITGVPNDYVEPVDKCAEPDPCAPVGMVPAGMMLVPTHTVQHVPTMIQPQVTVTTVPTVPTSPVRLPSVPQSYVAASVPQYQSQQFVGAPTVTRHSVVTTSQPVVSTTILGNGNGSMNGTMNGYNGNNGNSGMSNMNSLNTMNNGLTQSQYI